jgi:hypothetical protein
MKMLVTSKASQLVLLSSFALAAAACSGKTDASQDSASAASGQSMSASGTASSGAAASGAAASGTATMPILLRGTVQSDSAGQLVLKSDTGLVTVKVTEPFHVYNQGPSTLANVKDSTFIGVTTVKQPDGSERATEIHIFPEELRGLGEGSRMMAPDTSNTARRMTNGNVSASRMTNGAVAQSRMSNGSVSNKNGSTMVVQYAGGSQTVTVPPGTPVTELKPASKPLAAGDQVAVIATKAADGSLTSDKAVAMTKKK